MTYVIAQLSDIHIGGPSEGSGRRFSAALAEINSMSIAPDLVLITGDLTHNGSQSEWDEFTSRLEELTIRWVAIAGNHDGSIAELVGHRTMQAGPLRLVLLDTSNDEFDPTSEAWLEAELSAHPDAPTVIAIHQPPFETGIWWMDHAGLKGKELFERVVRSHRQVITVLSGHVHRPIQTNWAGCSLWVCPSTAVAFAADLDPSHEPAVTAEAPTFGLHVYTGERIVSHLVPVGEAGTRSLLKEQAPEFVDWVTSGYQTNAVPNG